MPADFPTPAHWHPATDRPALLRLPSGRRLFLPGEVEIEGGDPPVDDHQAVPERAPAAFACWLLVVFVLLLYPLARGGLPRSRDGVGFHPADRLVTHVAALLFMAWIALMLLDL